MHRPVPKYLRLGFQGHHRSNTAFPDSFAKDNRSPKVGEQHRESLQAQRSCGACNPPGWAAKRVQPGVGCKTRPASRTQRRSDESSSKKVHVRGRATDGGRGSSHLPQDGSRSPGTNGINPGWEVREKSVRQPGKGAKGAGVRQGQGLARDEHRQPGTSITVQTLSSFTSTERLEKNHLAIYKLDHHISQGSL